MLYSSKTLEFQSLRNDFTRFFFVSLEAIQDSASSTSFSGRKRRNRFTNERSTSIAVCRILHGLVCLRGGGGGGGGGGGAEVFCLKSLKNQAVEVLISSILRAY